MRGALLLGLVVLAGCQAVAPLPPQASLRVLSVAPAELGATAHGREEPGLAEACRDWRLHAVLQTRRTSWRKSLLACTTSRCQAMRRG